MHEQKPHNFIYLAPGPLIAGEKERTFPFSFQAKCPQGKKGLGDEV